MTKETLNPSRAGLYWYVCRRCCHWWSVSPAADAHPGCPQCGQLLWGTVRFNSQEQAERAAAALDDSRRG